MSIIGCVIIFLGVIISAFPFIANLYIGLGVFLGTGGCICAISGVLEINKRVSESNRGLAHGFSLAGNTVGGLLLPTLIAVLVDSYGYTGALILLSAIVLHIIPASLFFSNTKIQPPVKDSQADTDSDDKKKKNQVFRNPRLWFCFFGMASTTIGYTNFGLYLPLHLHSTLGWSKPHSAGMISVFAVGDMLGRLTGPALSDKFPPRWPWYCSGLAAAGTFMLLIPLTSTTPTTGAIVLAAGLSSGIFVGVYPALLSDELGSDNLSVTYPLSMTVSGFLNLAGPPILAVISSLLTTSHVMVILGVSLIIGSLPLAISSVVATHRHRMLKKAKVLDGELDDLGREKMKTDDNLNPLPDLTNVTSLDASDHGRKEPISAPVRRETARNLSAVRKISYEEVQHGIFAQLITQQNCMKETDQFLTEPNLGNNQISEDQDSEIFSQVTEPFSQTEEPVMDHRTESSPIKSLQMIETKIKLNFEQVNKKERERIFSYFSSISGTARRSGDTSD